MASSPIPRTSMHSVHVTPLSPANSFPSRRQLPSRPPVPASFLIPGGDLVPTDSVSNIPGPTVTYRSLPQSPSTNTNHDHAASPFSSVRSKSARTLFSKADVAFGLDTTSEFDLHDNFSTVPPGTEPVMSKSLIKAGWLWRRGSMLQWKRYYVKAYSKGMSAGCLELSIDDRSFAPIKSIDLTTCTQVIEKPAKPTSMRFELQLLLSRSDLHFAADSVAECTSWVSAIQTLIPRIVQPGLARIGAELEGATATVAHLSNERVELMEQNRQLQDKIRELEEQIRTVKSEAASARREQVAATDAARRGADQVARELSARIDCQFDRNTIITDEAERTRTALSIAHEDLSQRQLEIVTSINEHESNIRTEVVRNGDEVTKRVAEAVAELIKKFIAREETEIERSRTMINQVTSRTEDVIRRELAIKMRDILEQTRMTVHDVLMSPLDRSHKQSKEIMTSVTDLNKTVRTIVDKINEKECQGTDEIGILSSIESMKRDINTIQNEATKQITTEVHTFIQELVQSLVEKNQINTKALPQLLLTTLLPSITGAVTEQINAVSTQIDKSQTAIINNYLISTDSVIKSSSDNIISNISSHIQTTAETLHNGITNEATKSFEVTQTRLATIDEQLKHLHTEIVHLVEKQTHETKSPNSLTLLDKTASQLDATVSQLLTNLDKKVTRTHDTDHRLLLSIEERLDRLVHSSETLKRIDSSHTDKLNRSLTLLEEVKQANGWASRSQWRENVNTLDSKLDQILDELKKVKLTENELKSANNMHTMMIRHADSGVVDSIPVPDELNSTTIIELEQRKSTLQNQVTALTLDVDTLTHTIEELHSQRSFLLQERRAHAVIQNEVVLARKELDTITSDFATFERGTVARVQQLVAQVKDLEAIKGAS